MRDWSKGIAIALCAIGVGLMLSGNPQRAEEYQDSKAVGYRTAAATGMFRHTGKWFLGFGIALYLVAQLAPRRGSAR